MPDHSEDTTPATIARVAHMMKSRAGVIHMLDGYVSRFGVAQADADEILREWDALHFPNQVPRPQREQALRNVLARRACKRGAADA
jgi:hypothetical protein